MNIRIRIVLAAAVSGMLLGGCVSSGTYQAKELESQQLSRKLEETKTSYGELKDKFGKLEEANSEQTARLNKLSSEYSELKQENAKLATVNGEQSAGLKRSSVEAEELKLENAKLAETIKKLSENLKTISAEFVELKLENAKLAESLQPENILKTVAGVIETQKQKIKALTDENTKLKVKLVTQPALSPVRNRLDKAPVDKVEQPASPPAPLTKEHKTEPVDKAPSVKELKVAPVDKAPPIKELRAEPAEKSPAKNIEDVIAPVPASTKPELTPEPAESDSVVDESGSSGQTSAPLK